MWSDNETTQDLLGYQVHADLLKKIMDFIAKGTEVIQVSEVAKGTVDLRPVGSGAFTRHIACFRSDRLWCPGHIHRFQPAGR